MPERSDMPIVFPAPLPEEPQKSTDRELRAGVRYPFTAAAETYELRSKIRVTGRCADLGVGGCYVDTISPFPVGAVVRVRMERDKREFEAEAVVAYAHVSMGMGLAFTEIKPEHQEILRSWIADLSGEQPCEPGVSTAERETDATETNARMQLVLNELITLLIRKRMITETEGARLQRQMIR
jgi:hypothetical protein